MDLGSVGLGGSVLFPREIVNRVEWRLQAQDNISNVAMRADSLRIPPLYYLALLAYLLRYLGSNLPVSMDSTASIHQKPQVTTVPPDPDPCLST